MMFLRRGMTKQIRIEFLKTTWDLKYRVVQHIYFVRITNNENKNISVCVSIVQIEYKIIINLTIMCTLWNLRNVTQYIRNITVS